MDRRVIVLLIALAGCGGEPMGTDGGSRDDAASLDAPSSPDGELDCSVIGCSPPPLCSEGCTAPCGCCACGDGDEIDAGGETLVCSGGCYAPRGTAASGEACDVTSDCAAGLSCCVPCGAGGCPRACEPTCEPGTPGCAGGCELRP